MEPTSNRVVVVEDNPDIALWVSQALKFIADFDVRTVTANFSKLVGNGQWDGIRAVLADWNLPGFETSRLFEYLAKEKPHVRRVVFTAMPPEMIPRDNVDQILQKPASMDEIAKALLGSNQRGDDL